MQYAAMIESNSITEHDLAQISLQLPTIMPLVGITGAPAPDAKKKRRKPGDIVMVDVGTAEGEPTDGKKRKRGPAKEKKPKDPNAPKRPPSAYLLYQNEIRKEIRDQHPEMSYSQVLQEISKMWTALGPEEKKPYLDATDLAKTEYEKVKGEYEAEHPTGDAQAAAAATPAGDTDAPHSDEEEETHPPPPVPATKKEKAPAKKVAAKPTSSRAKAAPAPEPVAESSSSDSEDDGDDSDENDEEVETRPAKKSKKEPTPPPVSRKGKKESKRK